MKKYALIFSCLLLFFECNKESSTEPGDRPDDTSHSISGIILDKASSDGLSGTIVKIGNSQNTYQTTTAASGSFSFQDIQSGVYQLSTVTIQNSKTLMDTCGIFNTDSTDWGIIYSQTFASITGTIRLEGQTDYSFINVQLLGTDKSAVTTNQGKFRIDFLFPDTYDLYISKDDDYKEIRINDLSINQGDMFIVDTTINYRFKPLELEVTTDLSVLSDKDAGFCYVNDKFWYTNSMGLLKYDPINSIEEQVYILYNSSPFSSIHYLGIPYVTYDYDDGIWLSMDEPSVWYYRKYSISGNRIIDSVKVNSLPSHDVFNLAYDPISNVLVFFDYTSFYPKIYTYDPITKNVTTISFQLEEYNFDNYKSINIVDIFIDPTGRLYLILSLKDLNDQYSRHLYVCNSLENTKLIQIYKFPTYYGYWNRLSYYNNEIYTINRGTVYKFVF